MFDIGPSQGFMNQFQRTMNPNVQQAASRGFGGGFSPSSMMGNRNNSGMMMPGNTGYGAGIKGLQPSFQMPITQMPQVPMGNQGPMGGGNIPTLPQQGQQGESGIWQKYNQMFGNQGMVR